MNEQLRMISEKVAKTVIGPVRWFVDALKAYREDRVEVTDLKDEEIGNPFGNESYVQTLRSFKRVRFGGPIGGFIDNIRNLGTEVWHREQDIPNVIKRRQEMRGA
ncbi:hypothetical protein HYS91_01275 [Candidatus Daviesbacteria bacterium]|nr:hypothetical protein [Candidatus Daviesbacteria bacterium]